MDQVVDMEIQSSHCRHTTSSMKDNKHDWNCLQPWIPQNCKIHPHRQLTNGQF